MKQILQSYRSGELWLAEVPTPACNPGGVLVRTRRSLVSAGTEKMLLEMAQKSLLGKAKARPDLVKQVLKKMQTEGVRSTMEKVFAKLDEPICLGYSAAGEVLEAGRKVSSLLVGDRVAIAGAGYANHSEFNYVPENLCAKIPDGVSYADAAFATLGSIALQGVRQCDPQLGERIVVTGLGLLGLLTVQILKANGCAVLGVDLDPQKVELALQLGADAAVSSGAVQACVAFSAGRGADAVILTAATSSNGPIEQAAEMLRHKGRVVAVGIVGMNVPRGAFYHKELDLRLSMSYGPGRYDPAYEEYGHDYPYAYVRFTEQRNMESFLYLVQQGKVTPSALVTHRFAFDDALDAYKLLQGKLAEDSPLPKEYLGILLEYPDDLPLQPVLSLAGSAEQTADTISPQAQGTQSKALGVAIIGAGSFAKAVLLPQLSKCADLQLTGVCTHSGKSAQQTASNFKFEFATTEAEQIFSHPQTQAVFIATRHGSHASLTCAALRAGKHVFLEKPLCLNQSELQDLQEALEQARSDGHQPCLMVGFNRRFSVHAQSLISTFAQRTTPMVVSYRVNAGRIPGDHWIQDPAEGGGRIIGEACHFVDFCSALIGASPNLVTATSILSNRSDVLSEDSVVITVRYADGSLATLQYLAEGSRDLPKERCEVYADGQSAVMDNFSTTKFFGGGKSIRGKQEKGFAKEIQAFLEVCRSGGDWPIPWASLKETHQVCFAAQHSLDTGMPVPLS
jgi:predicted dehydrogenase/threonine dehydrogenase-like Zn-dependent dehydrogenase